MRRVLAGILFLALSAIGVEGQNSISELPEAHATALQQYFTQHPDLEFLPETAWDKELLKELREAFGSKLTPYYKAGDFNRDGRQDFALVLAKKNGQVEDQGSGISETHRYRHELAVIIFNGAKGGYQPVFIEEVKAPLVCFLNWTYEQKKRLVLGVFETEEHFIMTPAGNTYIVEYESYDD